VFGKFGLSVVALLDNHQLDLLPTPSYLAGFDELSRIGREIGSSSFVTTGNLALAVLAGADAKAGTGAAGMTDMGRLRCWVGAQ
jgi:hypothetical protein